MPTCVVLWLGVPFLVLFNEGNGELGANGFSDIIKGGGWLRAKGSLQKFPTKKGKEWKPGVCLPPDQIKYSCLLMGWVIFKPWLSICRENIWDLDLSMFIPCLHLLTSRPRIKLCVMESWAAEVKQFLEFCLVWGSAFQELSIKRKEFSVAAGREMDIPHRSFKDSMINKNVNIVMPEYPEITRNSIRAPCGMCILWCLHKGFFPIQMPIVWGGNWRAEGAQILGYFPGMWCPSQPSPFSGGDSWWILKVWLCNEHFR